MVVDAILVLTHTEQGDTGDIYPAARTCRIQFPPVQGATITVHSDTTSASVAARDAGYNGPLTVHLEVGGFYTIGAALTPAAAP